MEILMMVRLRLFVHIALGTDTQKCQVQEGPVVKKEMYLPHLVKFLLEGLSAAVSDATPDLVKVAIETGMSIEDFVEDFLEQAFALHLWCTQVAVLLFLLLPTLLRASPTSIVNSM